MLFFFTISPFSFSQETPQATPKNQTIEAFPLLTVTGRVVTKGGNMVLITPDAKGYLLEKREDFAEAFKQVTEIANKPVDVTLSGFDTRRIKTFRFTDHKTKQATEEEYKVLPVALVQKIEEKSSVTNLNISRPIPYEKAIKDIPFNLRQISGKISRCNFQGVVPTIELEGKGLAFIIDQDTQVLKAVGENILSFKAKDVLKVGDEVEISYEEKGYQNIARMILWRSKKDTGQSEF